MDKGRTVKFNKREVTIPWSVVGTPEPDIKATIEAVLAAVDANKRSVTK